MPLPTSKEQLRQHLCDAYDKLDHEFDAVSSQIERDKSIEGDVSCCDILAYQIGWADTLLGWEAMELEGNVPAMPAQGYKWNQLGDLAQSFYDKESDKTLEHLRAEFKTRHDRLTGWIESLSDEELFSLHQRQWAGEKWALVKWIQVNTIAHYRSARTKVRRWKKESKI